MWLSFSLPHCASSSINTTYISLHHHKVSDFKGDTKTFRTNVILQTRQGLADRDNYHESCRLLVWFKVNHRSSKLANVEGGIDVATTILPSKLQQPLINMDEVDPARDFDRPRKVHLRELE
ncbi:hypothetical protein VNO77_16024 [Canavalia gladiata]|uniref:Uncharacterized protein n=1 Tax=Canavalia gladiata TaxID=3824 RepID=A0AAN9LZQ3_CANGL